MRILSTFKRKFTSSLIQFFRRLGFLPYRDTCRISLFEEIYGYQRGSIAEAYSIAHPNLPLDDLPSGISRIRIQSDAFREIVFEVARLQRDAYYQENSNASS